MHQSRSTSFVVVAFITLALTLLLSPILIVVAVSDVQHETLVPGACVYLLLVLVTASVYMVWQLWRNGQQLLKGEHVAEATAVIMQPLCGTWIRTCNLSRWLFSSFSRLARAHVWPYILLGLYSMAVVWVGFAIGPYIEFEEMGLPMDKGWAWGTWTGILAGLIPAVVAFSCGNPQRAGSAENAEAFMWTAIFLGLSLVTAITGAMSGMFSSCFPPDQQAAALYAAFPTTNICLAVAMRSFWNKSEPATVDRN